MKVTSIKGKAGAIIGSSAIIATLALGGTAFAQTATAPTTSTGHAGWGGAGMHRGNGIFGSVVSVSGSTITVSSKASPNGGTATTYAVDATNASVTKAGATSTVSSIAVGDMIMVQGTVSGTSVVATAIHDGVMRGMGGGHMMGMGGGAKGAGAGLSTIAGNGQPILGGTVASVSGTTLTITNKSNATYSVNASSATVTKSGATSTVSGIAVGDTVIVQGTVNGTSIAASSIFDQGTAPAAPAAGSVPASAPGQHGGMFGGIIGFFQHLFGF